MHVRSSRSSGAYPSNTTFNNTSNQYRYCLVLLLLLVAVTVIDARIPMRVAQQRAAPASTTPPDQRVSYTTSRLWIREQLLMQ
jgi:hypothetical protein